MKKLKIPPTMVPTHECNQVLIYDLATIIGALKDIRELLEQIKNAQEVE